MTVPRALAAAVSALLLPLSALAAGIDEKALLTPYPESNLISEKAAEFDEYELVTGGVDSAKAACDKKQKSRCVPASTTRTKKEPRGDLANYRRRGKAGFQAISRARKRVHLDGKPSNSNAFCGDRSIGTPSAGPHLAAKLPRKDRDVYLRCASTSTSPTPLRHREAHGDRFGEGGR
jgi:hypothetical protein